MVEYRAKLLVFWMASMLVSIINGDVVIPSSFMTLDPYTDAQNHYETVTPGYYKPQVLPQVSHDPPLSYNVVPGNPYNFGHKSNQQSLHHQPQYEQTHHQPHYQQTHHEPQYNHQQKPFYKPHTQKLYKPHALKLPVTPHVAHDKHFISHNAHTQHLSYTPPKIQKLIKKTPLDFPNKGYISHKLAPARDGYARALHFPSSGYNIDYYFKDFPAFGYFNYEPKHKLHGLDHHRRRRMLNFNDIDNSKSQQYSLFVPKSHENFEDSTISQNRLPRSSPLLNFNDIDYSIGQHDSSFIPNAHKIFKDSTLSQNRMPRSSTNDNLSSQKVQDFDDSPPFVTLLQRVARSPASFPQSPKLPRLLEPRSAHDKENSWLNQ